MEPETLVFVAGLGQLALVAGSVVIPKVMRWKEALSETLPIIRQMFYTYAGYILGINIFFGAISVLKPSSLLDKSFLAISLSLLISLYWFGRIVIQFTYFDRSGFSESWHKYAEAALVIGFFFFCGVYTYATVLNLME